MAFAHRKPWQSKLDGIQSAKTAHFCTSCMYQQKETWGKDPCPRCKTVGSRVYMKSEVELQRGAELIISQRAGQITNLRFQPRYDLIVNSDKICTYVGDFEYRENGKIILEDVKPLKFMDGEAKLKIAMFNALYKSMNMSVTLHKKA